MCYFCEPDRNREIFYSTPLVTFPSIAHMIDPVYSTTMIRSYFRSRPECRVGAERWCSVQGKRDEFLTWHNHTAGARPLCCCSLPYCYCPLRSHRTTFPQCTAAACPLFLWPARFSSCSVTLRYVTLYLMWFEARYLRHTTCIVLDGFD